MSMYGDEYKYNKSGKDVKEKEEKSDICKDTSQEVKKVVPSMEKTNQDKKRTFTPSLTPEPKEKRTNFTTSMELSKEPKKRTFTPTLDIDTNKKRRNFSPSLEMSEKKERDFKPELNIKKGRKERAEKPRKSNSPYKYDIKDMQKIAIERGGECLSENYEGIKKPLNWRCKNGHEWETAPTNVLNKGTWCPECAGHYKYTIEDMQEVAKSRGGKCLSEKYIDNKTNLKWQCDKGHKWEATLDNVKNKGTWCPECAGHYKYTIEDMLEVAKSRGGKCLSEKYIDSKTKLRWQCSKGHEWEAVPQSINNQDTWCPECAGQYKYTIKDMQELAKIRGGKCLSDKYINAKTNLKWECSNGHKWEATPDNVKNKESWCPKCADGLAERTCRQFFEKLFNEAFKKTYPSWLKNPNGNMMHLDGYNRKLKLAFEYQGSQHYIFTPYFHKTLERFNKDQNLDKLKEELCKKQFIKLIKIPYTVKVKDMENFIRTQVKNLGIKAPMNPNRIDYRKFKFNTKSKLKQMQELTESRGGKLLSTKYINARTKLQWQCKKGHTWWATPNNIKNNAKGRGGLKGNWCPECAQRKKYTIDDVKKFAKSKGGECLSTTYERSQATLKWRCENNHEFETSFFNVKVQNYWCPECKKENYIQFYKNLAKERGGKCLSEEYQGVHTKLEWQCEEGHRWTTTPNSIRQGSWCPECVGQHKYNINDMKTLAKSH